MLFGIELDSTNNTFVFTETGTATTFTVTLEAGEYFTHNDTDGSVSAYPGIFAALETAIGAEATTNAFTFDVTTPTESTEQLYHGVQLVGDTATFSIDFADASFTMDSRIFGFPATQAADVSAISAGATFVVQSAFQIFAQWRSVCRHGDNHASEKRRDRRMITEDSHQDEGDRFVLVHKSQKLRPMRYQFVRAAHVWAEAASEEDFAVVGDVATGDDHNALEYLWLAFRKNQKVLVLHNVGEVWDLKVSTHTWEMVKRSGVWADRFMQFLRVKNRSGENYSFTVETAVLDNVSVYSH